MRNNSIDLKFLLMIYEISMIFMNGNPIDCFVSNKKCKYLAKICVKIYFKYLCGFNDLTWCTINNLLIFVNFIET